MTQQETPADRDDREEIVYPPRPPRANRARDTRRRIQRTAIRLFAERGYDHVTVEEVARAVGVSHMTVFRHFPAKSALVLYDEYDDILLEILRTREVATSIGAMIVEAYREIIARWRSNDLEFTLTAMRIVLANPGLQGSIWSESIRFQDDAERILIERFGDELNVYQTRVLLSALSAVVTTGFLAWGTHDGTGDLTALFDEGIAVLRRDLA